MCFNVIVLLLWTSEGGSRQLLRGLFIFLIRELEAHRATKKNICFMDVVYGGDGSFLGCRYTITRWGINKSPFLGRGTGTFTRTYTDLYSAYRKMCRIK